MIRNITDDSISWETDRITKKMESQMKKICARFGVTITEWFGNNDKPQVVCRFTPSISEEQADEFYEFVMGLSDGK